MRIDALSEQYNGAQLALETAQQTAADAQARIDAAEAETARLQQARRRSAPRPSTSGRRREASSTSSTSPTGRTSRCARSTPTIASERDDAARRGPAGRQGAADHAQGGGRAAHEAVAQQQQTQIASAKSEIEAANAQQQQLLSKVNGELQQLIAQEQARRAAEAAARARARFAPRAHGAVDPGSIPNMPPPSARAGHRDRSSPSAARQALPVRGHRSRRLRLLGAHDAGLGRGRRRAAHYSGAQYSSLPHVPLDQMQPGDLVFWGAGGSRTSASTSAAA